MESLRPTLATFLTLALSSIAVCYFFARFCVRRNIVSLALMFMVSGWGVCAMIVSGDIKRENYDVVGVLGVVVSIFLLVSLFMIEFWEDYRRSVRKNRWREEQDEEARRAAEEERPTEET